MVVGIGTYGNSFVLNKIAKGGMADTGSNCSMTANWMALKNVKKMEEPFTVGIVVTNNGNFSN